MKTKKLVLDTKKPLGSPTGLKVMLSATLIVSIVIETQVAPKIIASGNTIPLFFPLAINIIPMFYPLSKWINLYLIHYKEHRALMKVVHSEQLIDYESSKKKSTIFDQKKVLYGVKIILEETSEGISITFYPNGIKNSDRIKTLSSRLEEAFRMNVLSVNSQLSYTTYLLRDVNNQKIGVTNNDF